MGVVGRQGACNEEGAPPQISTNSLRFLDRSNSSFVFLHRSSDSQQAPTDPPQRHARSREPRAIGRPSDARFLALSSF